MRTKISVNSPSMTAGLYFAKPGMLFNKNYSYVNPEGQKISPEGVRYFEDESITLPVREKFANVPILKKLSAKHDTFVNLVTIFDKDLNQNRFARINISYADYLKKQVNHYEIDAHNPSMKYSFLNLLDDAIRSFFLIDESPKKVIRPEDDALHVALKNIKRVIDKQEQRTPVQRVLKFLKFKH